MNRLIVIARNDQFPLFRPARLPRGNSARSASQVSERAVSHPGITPVSGAAAVLRPSEEDTQRQHSDLTRPVSAAAGIGPLVLADDILRVVVGLLVFIGIAYFFWVLA